MALDARDGLFEKQHSQQIITMLLHCTQGDCKQPVINRNYLVDHMWSKHRIKRYVCLWSDCSQSFDDFEPLGMHIRRTHGRNQTWKCVMPNCTKTFRSHNRLHRHVYHQHSDGLFRCGHPGCGFGPHHSRNVIYSHYRKEHRPRGCNDPFTEATYEETERNNPCAICIRPMTRFSQNRRLPRCVHVFHLRCILQWTRRNINRNCPSCRAQILPFPPV